ncbi:rhodanese-like domain-containing protein [Ralstonia solanacearum]|uniref:rhodanese-like domain-containing protein n=1 Tax=Ralstonia solanacearum TaxID=305 RepID=UPI00078EB66C|nr:rhodanese-like domain-containing protein [Ralstonia solanacearum]AMP39572.1 sulfurtransferase [Ralstonia solanacearum]AXV88413.1 sulfurtransferase [Ralstonia solanacearum]AXW07889.1 sulfurtransferase [Ralstonia solanacearum]AXW25682.1 sulfurtransferase [Ralstonia solanacearum]AXW82590.1 sulfurtransferase [Ralstonia solanacearum]
MSIPSIEPVTLKPWLHDGAEIALFDVREAGEFGEGHLLLATPVPYSRLEIDAVRLAPRRSVRLVVVDADGGTLAALAARRLRDLGYGDVSVLRGGVAAWRAAGLTVFKGVNVPSKTFGELAELAYRTPHITAAELVAWQRARKPHVLLDGRTVAEYRRMTIPGAVACPNGELALRAHVLIPDDETPVVIHCAGRTRSIIGAQTLRNLGLPNPVYALENGTQGWQLHGLTLEHGADRRYPETVDAPTCRRARRAAAELSRRFEVPSASAAAVRAEQEGGRRSVFLLDVRTAEAFARGSLPCAVHAPGGQLLQATDQYVGVRGARLVVFDDDGIRAPVIASWLRQMGHDAVVLDGGLSPANAAALASVLPASASLSEPAPAPVREIDAAALRSAIAHGQVLLIDLRSSAAYRAAHLPGAHWATRRRLAGDLLGVFGKDIVLIDDDPAISALAAIDLRELGIAGVHRLAGGVSAWRAAGHSLVATPDVPPDAERIDYLFFVHDRHEGNLEAARGYLSWEIGLVAQLDARERAGFAPGVPAEAQPAAVEVE